MRHKLQRFWFYRKRAYDEVQTTKVGRRVYIAPTYILLIITTLNSQKHSYEYENGVNATSLLLRHSMSAHSANRL